MKLTIETFLYNYCLLLLVTIRTAKSNLDDFNGWTEVVGRGEIVPIVTSSSGCTYTHQKNVLSNMLPCIPRPTLVALPRDNGENENGNGNGNEHSAVHLIPSYVSIERCSGSCFGSPSPGAHDCQPSAKENVTFQVMSVHTTFSTGQWDTICTTATVERHLACQCSCRQKPTHCNPQIHFYDSASCTCQCKNQADRVSCNSANASGKKWDPRTCSCMCPRSSWRLCSTGYTYDFRDSCSCVRTYSMIASGGLTFLVVFVVAFCVIATLLVLHFRTKRNNFHRRIRSDSNIERLLREAFISDDSTTTTMRMTPVTTPTSQDHR